MDILMDISTIRFEGSNHLPWLIVGVQNAKAGVEEPKGLEWKALCAWPTPGRLLLGGVMCIVALICTHNSRRVRSLCMGY